MKIQQQKNSNKGSSGKKLRFPADLLSPIGDFLSTQIKKLETRKKRLEAEDPFADDERLNTSAAIDAEAAEQFGHVRISALKRDVDRKIIQIRKALSRVRIGKYGICEKCGRMIDTDRLTVYPEATLCVSCEKKRER